MQVRLLGLGARTCSTHLSSAKFGAAVAAMIGRKATLAVCFFAIVFSLHSLKFCLVSEYALSLCKLLPDRACAACSILKLLFRSWASIRVLLESFIPRVFFRASLRWSTFFVFSRAGELIADRVSCNCLIVFVCDFSAVACSFLVLLKRLCLIVW